MKRSIISVMVLAGITVAAPAAAQEEQANEEAMSVTPPRLGLDPGAPQNPSGNISLNNGYESTRNDDWVFNFHGQFQLPVTFTVGPRDARTKAPGQTDTIVHYPAFYPGSNPSQFAWTGAIPPGYVQLAMTYGSPEVKGTLLMQGSTFESAFVTVDLTEALGQMIRVTVGDFHSRYGIMGENDLGRYGTPLFAGIKGPGETAQIAFNVDDMGFLLEQGFALPGVDANAPTVASHFHGGFSYAHLLQLGLHYIDVRNVSDQKPGAGGAPTTLPAFPSATFVGAEARLTAKQYGHLYVGGGKHTFEQIFPSVQYANFYPKLGGGYRVFNTSGQGIIDEYLGFKAGGSSQGNGGMLVAGAQYDLSVANLLYPELEGYGPDVFASVFGVYEKTDSDDVATDGKSKSKFGVEATYAMMSWLSAGIRADVVNSYNPRKPVNAPLAGNEFAYQMISPRVIFKSDWNSNDQVVLQYSRINYGKGTIANGPGGDQDQRVYQDENVITAFAGLWW